MITKRIAILRGARLAVLCALVILVAGCRSARREEPIAGPLRSASSEVTQGKVAYMRYCHACHPQGNGGLGPSLNDKPLPGFGIRTQVRRGFGTMPGFDKDALSQQELDHIVAYMKALRKHRDG
jgi:mono/diheme cytochrome c family protein